MADFDASKPSIPRVIDYLQGGKDNFAADRDLGDQMIEMVPEAPLILRENRQMLAKAVTWAAEHGIRQFIDLGCGLPTSPNTHETARLVAPDAKIAYVDGDPVVISHLSALFVKDPQVTVVASDAGDSATALAGIREFLDLSRPACFLLGALVHFLKEDEAGELVGEYSRALAPGSYVVMTAGYMPPCPTTDQFVATARAALGEANIHPAQTLLSILDGLEILPPGVVDARVWEPDTQTVPDVGPRGIWMNGVMARVPDPPRLWVAFARAARAEATHRRG